MTVNSFFQNFYELLEKNNKTHNVQTQNSQIVITQ